MTRTFRALPFNRALLAHTAGSSFLTLCTCLQEGHATEITPQHTTAPLLSRDKTKVWWPLLPVVSSHWIVPLHTMSASSRYSMGRLCPLYRYLCFIISRGSHGKWISEFCIKEQWACTFWVYKVSWKKLIVAMANTSDSTSIGPSSGLI